MDQNRSITAYVWLAAQASLPNARATGDIDHDGITDLIAQDKTGNITAFLLNTDGSVKSTKIIFSGKTKAVVSGFGK